MTAVESRLAVSERIGFGPRFVAPIVVGSLLNPVNSTMIATALVPIGRAYRVGSASTAWLVAGLYLASAIAQPVAGKVADRFGPRRVYLVGLVLVCVAGLGGLWAPSLGFLVAVRVLLGIGTSAAYPAAMAMVAGQSRRLAREAPGSVLGALTIAGLVSAAIGPALGGFLVAVSGWKSIFAVNVPLALVGIALTWVWLPADETTFTADEITLAVDKTVFTADEERPGAADSVWTALDPPGIVLFGGMLTCLLIFLMRLGHPRWYLLAGAIGLCAVLIRHELRAARPFLDVRMLARNRPLTATYVRYAATFFALYCILYGYPQWLEQAHGYGTAETGIILLPMSLLAAVCSWLGARRRAPWGPLLLGTTTLLAASLLLLFAHSTSPVALLVFIGLVFGLPNGLNTVANQSALYEQAPAEEMGTAAGLFRSSQYVGAIASASVIALLNGSHASDHALHRLALILAVLSALLLLALLPRIRPRHGLHHHQARHGLHQHQDGERS